MATAMSIEVEGGKVECEDKRLEWVTAPWSDDEVKKLLAVDLADPTTWPEYMLRKQASRKSVTPGYAASMFRNMAELKHAFLLEAVERQQEREALYKDALIDALWKRVPVDSLEHKLLFELDSVVNALHCDAVGICIPMVPALDKAFPIVDPEAILQQMGAPRREVVEEEEEA